MVGNFIGDFVRGRNLTEQFEAEIARGIELHRAIDAFTDQHSIVKKSKDRLRPTYRHYAGVIVDVFYDHYLALHWNNYHPLPLEDFAGQAYSTLLEYDPILPSRVKHMLPFMMKGNWLVQYSKIEGIHRALTGMANRTPYDSKMEHASVDLRASFDEFQNEFIEFFSELKSYSERWLVDH